MNTSNAVTPAVSASVAEVFEDFTLQELLLVQSALAKLIQSRRTPALLQPKKD